MNMKYGVTEIESVSVESQTYQFVNKLYAYADTYPEIEHKDMTQMTQSANAIDVLMNTQITYNERILLSGLFFSGFFYSLILLIADYILHMVDERDVQVLKTYLTLLPKSLTSETCKLRRSIQNIRKKFEAIRPNSPF